MLHSAGTMCGFNVITADGGHAGPVYELLVDDAWTVRYFFVDAGVWMTGRSVLLSTDVVETVDTLNKTLVVKLTREDILCSPWVELSVLKASDETAYFRVKPDRRQRQRRDSVRRGGRRDGDI